MAINPSILKIASTVIMLVMALTVIFVRVKATNRPVTVKKIIIPPVAMSTGFSMFIVPETHIPFSWAIIAFLFGWFVFSYPLIKGTKYHKQDGQVFIQRSKSFIYIMLGLLSVRLLLHGYIEEYMSIAQTGALFYLLAFGMITHWRVAMYREYKRITLPEAEATVNSLNN